MKSSRMGIITLAMSLLATSVSTAQVALDYDFYKNRVEPIFLKTRPGHGRCYVCHADSNNAFRLQKLSPGSSTWSEEQSQQNRSAFKTRSPEMRYIVLLPQNMRGGAYSPATVMPSIRREGEAIELRN